MSGEEKNESVCESKDMNDKEEDEEEEEEPRRKRVLTETRM